MTAVADVENLRWATKPEGVRKFDLLRLDMPRYAVGKVAGSS